MLWVGYCGGAGVDAGDGVDGLVVWGCYGLTLVNNEPRVFNSRFRGDRH